MHRVCNCSRIELVRHERRNFLRLDRNMNKSQSNIKCEIDEQSTELVPKEELGCCSNEICVTERVFESTNRVYKSSRFVDNACTNEEFFKYDQNCSRDDHLQKEIKQEIEYEENLIDAIIKDESESIDVYENKVIADHFIYKEANICDNDTEDFEQCSKDLSNQAHEDSAEDGTDRGVSAGKNLQSSAFDECINNLNKHMNSVHNFECDPGDFGASDDGEPRKRAVENNPSAKHFECETCDFATTRRYRLKDHVEAVHLKMKKYTCGSCDYRSYSKGGIKAHVISIHTERNDIKCHLCDYETNKKNDLTRHVNSVHLKLKHFECLMCDYATCRKSDLKKHFEAVHLKQHDSRAHSESSVKLHANNAQSGGNTVRLKSKNQKCSLCDYKTYKKSTLDSHVNAVHLKLRNFKCHMCDYAATRVYGLKHHLEAVHMHWNNQLRS